MQVHPQDETRVHFCRPEIRGVQRVQVHPQDKIRVHLGKKEMFVGNLNKIIGDKLKRALPVSFIL